MMEIDRYIHRRRMAWRSYWMIVIFGSGIIVAGLSSDGVAQRVEDLSFLISTVLGVWVSIVLAYFGACVVTDRAEIKSNKHTVAFKEEMPIDDK